MIKRGVKWSYQDLYNAFSGLGCTLLTTEQEFIDNNLSTMTKVTFIAKCGHERILSYNQFSSPRTAHHNCVDCNNKIGRENSHTNRIGYEEFEKRFTDKGCKLLMSEEEYYSNRTKTENKVVFIARCGHERESSYSSMRFSKDWSCNDCTNKRTSLLKKIDAKIEGSPSGNLLEYQAFIYLQETLVEKFNIVRMYEGSKSDFIIKPIDVINNEWLQIQLKSTKKIINDKYQFGINNRDYSGMLVIAVCVNANLCWSIEGEFIKNIQTLTCSTKCDTKYKPYQSSINDLNDIIELYYSCRILDKIKVENSYVSNNPQGVQEYKYVQKRITGLKLPFIASPVESMNFDFTINDKKVQEKVTTKSKSRKMTFDSTMSKCYGRMTRGPYEKGDNDFYWFHLPKLNRYYVIPEELLINWKVIKTDDQQGKTKVSFHPDDDKYRKIITEDAKLYLFDYSKNSLKKLKEMFEIL